MNQEEINKLVLESLERVLKDPKTPSELAHGVFEGWRAYLMAKYGTTPEEYAKKVRPSLGKETRE